MLFKHSRFAAVSAVVVAALLVLVVAVFCVGVPRALADPGDPYSVGGVNQEASNTAVINADATTQLSIHKYLGADSGVAGDGTEQVITGHDLLQGVQMDVYRVSGVDLTTNAGWTVAAELEGHALTVAEIAAGSVSVGGNTYPLILEAAVVTDSSGTATFTKVNGVGLYAVAENINGSDSITNVTSGAVIDKALVTGASPFFVTLPMTNPNDTERWMYDVHVYPKNQADSALKAVVDKGTVTTDGVNVGNHQVDYAVTSSITDGTASLGAYAVYDDLDSALSLTGVSVVLSDGTQLNKGVDYEVYTDVSQYRVPGSSVGTVYPTGGKVSGGPVVSIVFFSTGLGKLETNRDLQVVTTISTELGAQDTDGVLDNTASFIPSQTWFDQHPVATGTPPGTLTNQVTSKYGNVIVTKQDPTNTSADMSGARFAIYADPTPGDGQCSEEDVSGTPIATETIVADNKLTFTGLQASNWYNGADVTNPANWLSYCLVETHAPTGYNLDATPHYITIDWSTQTGTSPAFASELINNEKTNVGNMLPLTGGKGLIVLSVIGAILLVGGAASYYISARKRRNNQNTNTAR